MTLHQSTFFEKKRVNELEREFGLGEPSHESQDHQFANHKKFNERFFATRRAVAERLGVPLAGWGLTETLPFIDEFHCDRDGIRLLAQAVGDMLER